MELAPRPPVKPRKDALPLGPPPLGSQRILGTRIDATSYSETADAVLDLAAARAGGAVCTANVHVLMEAFDDPDYQRGLNAADRVTPDGVPLVWTLRRRGIGAAERVYGPRLMEVICRRAAESGVPIGLYGSTWPVLDALVARLTRRFPSLRVAYVESPPFRELSPEEDREVVAAIQESGVGILFVGLGCPRQERWLAAHRQLLPCVLVSVGAAFDFLAGQKPQAPAWLQRAGLEWAFRLACEPRRLWRRYLLHNPRFLFQLAREFRRGAPFRAPVAGRGSR